MDNHKIKILLLEDNPDDALQIPEIFEKENISYAITIVDTKPSANQETFRN